MMTCCVPLPSCPSPGQYMTIAQSSPSRFVSLKFPSSMWPHMNASQCPCVDFAPNWHGQPGAQLQFSNSVPWITHRSDIGLSSFLALSELLPRDGPPVGCPSAAQRLQRTGPTFKLVEQGDSGVVV